MQLSTSFKMLNMFNVDIYMFQMQMQGQKKQHSCNKHSIYPKAFSNNCKKVFFFFNKCTSNKLH